jgi:hypothetical protein
MPKKRLSVGGALYFLTSPLRVLPDFLIIGAMKCGTTSLFHYVKEHPWIRPALKKELFYFSNENPFWRNNLWYRAHFPLIFAKVRASLAKKKLLAFEATPGYIFHPLSAARIYKTVPNAKFILSLRNPVDRTYSHYHNVVRTNNEPLSFEAALEREKNEFLGTNGLELDYLVYSYLGRSLYIDQIESWLKFFPREQLLIFDYGEFSRDTRGILEKVFTFLDVPMSLYPFPKRYSIYESGDYTPMNPETRRDLVEFFRPYNERLYDFLGVDFGWERA